jgi:GNAT superfamily N-acetyltransferase
MLASELKTCYVAVTADGHPCFIQWLIGPEENAKVARHFKGVFPWLAADEALLEGGFTLEAYRGRGIMSWAIAEIAARSVEAGARWVVTFVNADNLPSLKACRRAGFVPYLRRTETWRLFRHQVTFTPLPPGTPIPFDLAPAPADRLVETTA